MSDNNFTKLLAILIKPFQDIESMFQQLLALRNLDDAEGAQLTILGELVGQPRNGVTDDTLYRRYVRTRVAVNRSKGTTNDLIKVARLALNDDAARFEVLTQNYATVVVRLKDVATTHALAQLLLGFLKDAAAGGVRVILEYSTVDPSLVMRWGVAGKGWTSRKWKTAIA